MIKRNAFSYLVPVVCVVISCLMLFTTLEAKFSDLFQRILPPTQLRNDVLLVGVDDYSIETIGSFPFTRDVYADCITVMEEMGADSVVFDLSFIDHARAGVNDNFEPFYPDEVMEDTLKDTNRTYLNFTFDYFTDIEDEDKAILDEKGLLKNLEAKDDTLTVEFTGVVPTISNFLKYAAGAGFVNADPDRDNYYRRVYPVAKYDGEYYGLLTFPAVLKKLGNPEILVEKRKITLKTQDDSFTIPRGNDGKLILKYPNVQFNDYNYLSIGDIYRIVQLRLYMQEDGSEYYIDEYNELYEMLREKLQNALCIIGTCATSTSDYGVNQYEAQYPLPGVHYTFANQILNRDFVSESPVWVSVLYGLIFALLIVFVTSKIKSTGAKIFYGLLILIAESAVLVLYYKFTRIYVGEVVPLVSSILTYIFTLVIGFLSASKDKKFITNVKIYVRMEETNGTTSPTYMRVNL